MTYANFEVIKVMSWGDFYGAGAKFWVSVLVTVIGGLIRGNESKIAIGSTRIEAYDRVVVFALPHAVKEIDSFFK